MEKPKTNYDKVRILVEVEFYIVDKFGKMITIGKKEIETNSSSVAEYPQFDIDNLERKISIKAKEIRYYRDGGAGGLELVNKVLISK